MDNWAQVQLLSRLGITTWMRGDSSARLIENEFIRLHTENGRLRAIADAARLVVDHECVRCRLDECSQREPLIESLRAALAKL